MPTTTKTSGHSPADVAEAILNPPSLEAAAGLPLQGRQGQDVLTHGRVSDQSEADSLQYGMGAEGDKAAAYQYSSDTSMPTQDGGLQWSIGGVPLQQQLRSATLHASGMLSQHTVQLLTRHSIVMLSQQM